MMMKKLGKKNVLHITCVCEEAHILVSLLSEALNLNPQPYQRGW